MCGIAVTRTLSRIEDMLETMSHRGPDERTIMHCGSVSIGHNRLAIVDVNEPRAKQPYRKGDSHVTLFNGEIFNYKSVLTNNSTEIEVIADLLHRDLDLGQILNGYFAVVQYDISRNKIVMARDVFGVMPLYYTLSPFAIASERKALLIEGKKVEIHEVPANTRLEYCLDKQRITKKREYQWPFNFGSRASSTEESDLFRLYLAFKDAVRRVASHSDVGYSIALSGGLDSSMILAECHSLVRAGMLPPPNEIITTYTQKDDTSELDRANELVEQLDWGHLHIVRPVLEMTPETINWWIETPPNPIRDFAFRRHATVAQNSTAKVILCGEGADEIGLGYPQNREMETPLDLFLRKQTWLKSQRSMTLDRVNKAGMMYSKEYRVPFLDIDFVQHALHYPMRDKDLLRKIAKTFMGLPAGICNASKYSQEEVVGRALPIPSLPN